MEQRHDAADHVLCVLSDEYLKAPLFDARTERCAVAGRIGSGLAL
jgi:hypothetical protein